MRLNVLDVVLIYPCLVHDRHWAVLPLLQGHTSLRVRVRTELHDIPAQVHRRGQQRDRIQLLMHDHQHRKARWR